MEIILVAVLFATDSEPPRPLVEAIAPTIVTCMVSGEIVNTTDLRDYRGFVYSGRYERIANLIREMRYLPRVSESQFMLPTEQLANLMRLHVDNNDLYRIFAAAHAASDECVSMWGRRHALADLRRLIGDQMFYSGRLP